MRLLLAPAIVACASFGLAQSDQAKPAPGPTQPNARYELGWRVRALERAWATNADVDKRKLALPHVEAAVQRFFGLKLSEAAEQLDLARLALESNRSQCNWNDAWALTPERRLVDDTLQELKLGLTQFYRPCNMQDVVLTASFDGDGVKRYSYQFSAEIGEVPEVDTLGLAQAALGDRRVEFSIFNGDFVLSKRTFTLSIVERCAERLAALEAALGALPETAPRLERESGKALLALLQSLAKGSSEETDYPGARLLAEAEQLVAAAAKGERFYAAPKTGEFWLTVPTSEKRTTRVRVFVPPPRSDGAAPPLVLALHGAGGSENMFFDSYGDGEIVRQCERRGWMLVAPRLGFGGVAAGPLLDALAERFAFDASRVFLVGHSMGAGAGCALVLDQPARYRAFAALGGGQALKNAEKLRNLDVFVAAGERDFGLGGAKQLHASLVAAGCERAQFRLVANTEHLLVVQDALPEVFAWFDSLASAAKDTPDASGGQRTER